MSLQHQHIMQSRPVADPDQVFGGKSNKGAPKSLNCINTQGCRLQLLGITQKWLPLVGQESGFFVGRTM